MTAYLTLFAVSFLAATLLPFYSEIVLFALLQNGYSPTVLLAVATLGNTLGAVVNWAIGRFLLHYQHKKWFFISESQLLTAQRFFNRYGKWCLLFAWMPAGGDALTFIAGVMRVNFLLFLFLVGVGKFGRYAAVIYFSDNIF